MSDRDNPAFKREIMVILSRQTHRVALPILVAMGLIASFIAGAQPASIYISWWLFAAAITLLRLTILPRLAQRVETSWQRVMRSNLLLSGLQGLAHGSTGLFLADFSQTERTIATIIVLGLGAGAVATTAGHRPTLFAYIGPSLLGLSGGWIAVGLQQNDWAAYTLAAVCLLYGIVLMALARDLYNTFVDSFAIRSQQQRLNQELKTALNNAEAANQAKTRFLAAASHDLRQPIHTLSLFCGALGGQQLDPHSREIVEHMHTSLEALANQLDALLDISKLDANIIETQAQSINISGLLERLSRELAPVAEHKGLQFTFKPPESAQVLTDPLLLERVLRNLISNAIKYTDSGFVRLHSEENRSDFLIHISDSGIGIAPLEQEKVFEEFYQIHNPERDQRQGLGLGLAIVQRLCVLLGIELSLQSSPNQGSRFSLRLTKTSSQATPTPT
ncbi:MAG: HAMP domain-containing histidine kinase [Cellvibrionaceae bacterium]|nr:HAMP domain-containing histidine kinase [Cellvibrionaceae bacterium]MCV6625004.1 HAMP domain-containing histidine kinase [Cellvibrionaceae bacterium]